MQPWPSCLNKFGELEEIEADDSDELDEPVVGVFVVEDDRRLAIISLFRIDGATIEPIKSCLDERLLALLLLLLFVVSKA